MRLARVLIWWSAVLVLGLCVVGWTISLFNIERDVAYIKYARVKCAYGGIEVQRRGVPVRISSRRQGWAGWSQHWLPYSDFTKGTLIDMDDGTVTEGLLGRGYLPFWIPAAVAGLVIVALALLKRLIRVRSVLRGHCSRCGYDLSASTGQCPECGMPTEMTTARTDSGPRMVRQQVRR